MSAPAKPIGEDEDEGVLVLEQHFAIVPEWVLDADISDAALRLYAVLLRYGQTSGNRMPGRRLLANRLHKRSTDSVDRAQGARRDRRSASAASPSWSGQPDQPLRSAKHAADAASGSAGR
jgi:hypothetical protein